MVHQVINVMICVNLYVIGMYTVGLDYESVANQLLYSIYTTEPFSSTISTNGSTGDKQSITRTMNHCVYLIIVQPRVLSMENPRE